MQEWYILGVGKGVLFREMSSVQECPHRERFHYIQVVQEMRRRRRWEKE